MASDIYSADVIIKLAIKRNYDYLIKNLETGDILPLLFQEDIVNNEEKHHLDRIEQYMGPTRQTRILLDYILAKDEEEMGKFLEILHEKQIHSYSQVSKTMERIKGDVSKLPEVRPLDTDNAEDTTLVGTLGNHMRKEDNEVESVSKRNERHIVETEGNEGTNNGVKGETSNTKKRKAADDDVFLLQMNVLSQQKENLKLENQVLKNKLELQKKKDMLLNKLLNMLNALEKDENDGQHGANKLQELKVIKEE